MSKYIPCNYKYASKHSKCGKLLYSKNKTLQQNILNNNAASSKAQLIQNAYSNGKQYTNYVTATPSPVNHHFGNNYNTGYVLVNSPNSTFELK